MQSQQPHPGGGLISFVKRPQPFGDVPQFDGLSPDEMQAVCEGGQAVHVPQGWSMLLEGTPPDQAYLVVKGRLSVARDGEPLAELRPGALVGEIGLSRHRLRTGTVTALTPLEMLHLTNGAFRRLYRDMPAFRTAVDATVEARTEELADVRENPGS